jgi:ferrous iron transport protein B
MIERGWAFIKNAGTMILAVSILVWAAAYYPHRSEAISSSLKTQQTELEALVQAEPENAEAKDSLAGVENQIAGAYLRDSYLGRAGHAIEPVVKPLGWDWRLGCAAIASFPAREVVVATTGIIFNLGDEVDEGSSSLHKTLQDATWPDGRKLITKPVALSIMVFFALCAQCAATLATIRRETNSWLWPAFTFVYMTTLAYFAALVTYQMGSWLIS